MAFFDNSNAQNYSAADVEALNKALSAGTGTDSSQFTGGRALIPEDCEQETLNILAQSKEDCKVMSSIKTTKVGSTVHEKNLRDDEGDYKHLSVVEGDDSPIETNQSIKRKTFDMKFLQTKRGITQQMIAAETFEGALASEKISGINTIMKACEYLCFHGDSAVVPTEFDGFEAQIRKAAKADQNIIDLRGVSIGTYGEKLFDEISGNIFEKGGFVDKTLFPAVLAKDIKELFADRIRFDVADRFGALQQLPAYPTATGSTIKFVGEGAGADKFYHVKGKVAAEGNATFRPAAPTSVTASAATQTGSKFLAADAGDYKYTVHAINAAGISAGTAVAAAVTVAAGEGVTLTITPGSGVKATGYIICRSKKDGDEVMEMVRVADSGEATTTFKDINEELPGTASMLFLTENKIQSIYNFGQLMPVSTIPLGKRAAIDEFLVATYGALELYAPKYCGLVKGISYKGGLY